MAFMDYTQYLPGLLQSGMGAFQSFGAGYKDPTRRASETLSQIPGQAGQYLSPYMEAGKGALNTLQNQYSDLLGGNIYNKLSEGYQESPGYRFKLEQALGAGNNAAAAGGMLGTPLHQQESMQLAHDITDQEFQNYLNSQIGLYGLGLSGEQGLNQMGYGANSSMADLLSQALGQHAQLQFMGDKSRNQYKAGGLGNVVSGLGTAFLPFFQAQQGEQ